MATPHAFSKAARIVLLFAPLFASVCSSTPAACEHDAHLSLLQAKAKLVNGKDQGRHARGATTLLQVAQEELLNSADLQTRIGSLAQEGETARGASAEHSRATLRVQALVSFGDAASDDELSSNVAVLPFPSMMLAAQSASPPTTLPPLVFAQTVEEQPLPPFDGPGLPAEGTAARSRAEAEALRATQWQKMREEAGIDAPPIALVQPVAMSAVQPAAMGAAIRQQDQVHSPDVTATEPKSLADMIKDRAQNQGFESAPQLSKSAPMLEQQSKQQMQPSSDMIDSPLAFPDLKSADAAQLMTVDAGGRDKSTAVMEESVPVNTGSLSEDNSRKDDAVLAFPPVWSDPSLAAASLDKGKSASTQPPMRAHKQKQKQTQKQVEPQQLQPQKQMQAQMQQPQPQMLAQPLKQPETHAQMQAQPQPHSQQQPSAIRALPWQQKLAAQTQLQDPEEQTKPQPGVPANALPTLQEALADADVDDATSNQPSNSADAAFNADVLPPSADILKNTIGEFGDGKLPPAISKVKHTKETDAIINRFVKGTKPHVGDVEPPKGNPVAAKQLSTTHDSEAGADLEKDDESSADLKKDLPSADLKNDGRVSAGVENNGHASADVEHDGGASAGLESDGHASADGEQDGRHASADGGEQDGHASADGGGRARADESDGHASADGGDQDRRHASAGAADDGEASDDDENDGGESAGVADDGKTGADLGSSGQASVDREKSSEDAVAADVASKPMPGRRPKAGRKSVPVEDMPHPAPFTAPAGASSGLPAIGFLKTHKTGSSTITSIIHRIGDGKNLNFFLPAGQKHANGLGWPSAFPGKDAAEFNGMPHHQFDVVCNHAVYNDERMRSYLRPDPFFFTVLRHPMTQVQSAFDYYNPPCGSDWSERVAWLKKVVDDSNEEAAMMRSLSLRAQFMNPQSHDLGWYEHEGGAAVFDSNDDEVEAWVKEINQTISFVMLTEYLDEGLVLLAKKLNLQMDDVKYYYMKSGGVHKPPSAEQAAELRKLLHVDIHLYDHFSEKFWDEWDKAGGYDHLNDDLEELRGKNEELQQACGAGDKERCPWNYRTDSVQFTEYLKEKQAALATLAQLHPAL